MILGTAVYGTVRTVVWEDGMGTNPMPPTRLKTLDIESERSFSQRSPKRRFRSSMLFLATGFSSSLSFADTS